MQLFLDSLEDIFQMCSKIVPCINVAEIRINRMVLLILEIFNDRL